MILNQVLAEKNCEKGRFFVKKYCNFITLFLKKTARDDDQDYKYSHFSYL
jgi:hypothetical protein